MFGKQVEGTERHGHSVLHEGVTVRGEIEATGDIRLDGKLVGKITVSERLTIGPSGSLEAEVEAAEVILMGSVQGRIQAHRRLELRKGARMAGDIGAPVLLIEEGAYFHGSSCMEPEHTLPALLAGSASQDSRSSPHPEPVTPYQQIH